MRSLGVHVAGDEQDVLRKSDFLSQSSSVPPRKEDEWSSALVKCLMELATSLWLNPGYK